MKVICSICNSEFNTRGGLVAHLIGKHKFKPIDIKIYYDTNFKKYKEGICHCGNNTEFISMTRGYRKTCSRSCACKIGHKHMLSVIKEKYGVDNISQAQSIKDKKSLTCMKNYGVSNYMQSKEGKEKLKNRNPFLNPDIQESIQQNNILLYGGKSPMCSSIVIEKSRKTSIEKYGTSHPMKNTSVCNKAHLNLRENSMRNLYNNIYNNFQVKILNPDINSIYFNIQCEVCGEIHNQIHKQTLTKNLFKNHTPCPKCGYNNPYRSAPELEIEEFINSIYDGEVQTNRRYIGGVEFDIIIPEKKLCIEYNGLYWHGDIYKDKTFHIDKKKIAEDNGYNCIFIWEDDWLSNKEVVKHRLDLLLSKIPALFARKCEFAIVTSNEVKELLKTHHTQGYASGNLYSVLKYNNDIVSIMVFGKNRFEKSNKSIELIRYCPIRNISGGFDKLIKNSIKHIHEKHNIEYISTYCDLDWSGINKNIYTDRHWEDIGYSEQWWYYKSQQRFNRMMFTKKKMGVLLNNTKLSTNDMERELKINKVWGCGNKKYRYSIVNNSK